MRVALLAPAVVLSVVWPQMVMADLTEVRLYEFVVDQSAVVQTGGIAGIQRTCAVDGDFLLRVDPTAGTALFVQVDARLIGADGQEWPQSLNDVFNLTELAGTIAADGSIRFAGRVADGSAVWIGLVFQQDGSVRLQGETTPPPNSADFFVFALDAAAGPECATDGPCNPHGYPASSEYVLEADRGTVTLISGFAGIRKEYMAEGRLQLLVDLEAGIARFVQVGVSVIDPVGEEPDRHIDEILNLSGLTGTLMEDGSILFEGQIGDASDVRITLTPDGGCAYLMGKTVPPPNSADFPIFYLDAVALLKYGAGTGEPNDPYLICTAAQMNAIGAEPNDWDKHFRLVADLDLSNYTQDQFNQIGYLGPEGERLFSGVFDGNGHVIANFAFSSESARTAGLFTAVDGMDATIRNLGLVNPRLHAPRARGVGPLVGHFRSGSITACYVRGGSATGDQRVGGLIGISMSGLVADSYAIVDVRANERVGGLVGENLTAAVRDCFAAGRVTGETLAGGLIGFSIGQAIDSFWDTDTSGKTNSAGGTGLVTTAMQKAEPFLAAGWDFANEISNGAEDLWWILEGRDYPRLWWERPRDDFGDGEPGPLWFVYETAPEWAWLEEVNGRLEAHTAGRTEGVDAIYVSDGWRLDATKGFAVRVDFHFSNVGAGDGRVTLGFVPTMEEPVMQWAQFEAGMFDTGPFYLYEVRNDAWVEEKVDDRSSDNGKLYVSYDPETDELHFSHTGYGKVNAWKTVAGLVHGRWQAPSVYVTLGGGSEDGMALSGHDAWLDNFVVEEGAVVQ